MNRITVKIIMTFAVFLIPVYILLFISIESYLSSLQATAVSSAEAILELNINSLCGEIANNNRFFYNLQETDTDYIRLCSWDAGSESENSLSVFAVNRELVNQNSLCQYTDVFYVYVEEPELLLFAANSMTAEDKRAVKEALWESGLLEQFVSWQAVALGQKEYLAHTVGYYGVYAGALIDLENFCGQLEQQLGYEHGAVTVDEEQHPEPKEGYITITRKIQNTNAFLHITLDQEEISRSMPLVARRTYLVALVSLLLLPMLFFVFYRMIVKPLHRIEVGLKRLGEGQQDYRIGAFRSSSEFEGLKDSFNSMAGEIQSLKIESYEKQLEKERMLLQNLILQVHPHFLLNTFNQIFGMAQLKDFEGVQGMSMYLSRYFRYLFCSESKASIAEEVKIVKNYLEIMERRYLDCFVVEWELDEALLGYEVPPLILHNFVENIFKYAVSEGCETLIRISLKKEAEGVVLAVSDDGPGMEPEILKKIQAVEPVEKIDGTHIGIYNSAYRLEKLCGEAARLSVESVLTEGTRIRIVLPFVSEDGIKS